jgi:hypothetical protein
MEACYGGTDVMERSCAVARGIDINRNTPRAQLETKSLMVMCACMHVLYL